MPQTIERSAHFSHLPSHALALLIAYVHLQARRPKPRETSTCSRLPQELGTESRFGNQGCACFAYSKAGIQGYASKNQHLLEREGQVVARVNLAAEPGLLIFSFKIQGWGVRQSQRPTPQALEREGAQCNGLHGLRCVQLEAAPRHRGAQLKVFRARV